VRRYDFGEDLFGSEWKEAISIYGRDTYVRFLAKFYYNKGYEARTLRLLLIITIIYKVISRL